MPLPNILNMPLLTGSKFILSLQIYYKLPNMPLPNILNMLLPIGSKFILSPEICYN
jgi:hypothetical protein